MYLCISSILPMTDATVALVRALIMGDTALSSRGIDGGNLRGVRGGWFINGIIGLLWADDGLCYVSNDEGAKIIAVEVLESTAVSQKGGLAAEWREARAMTIHNVARAARSFLVAASC